MASANAQVTSTLRVLADALDSLPGLPPCSAGTWQGGSGFVQFSPYADVSDIARMIAVDSVLVVLGAADPASTMRADIDAPRYGGQVQFANGVVIDVYATNCDVEKPTTAVRAVTK
jgi:hypothetical protein